MMNKDVFAVSAVIMVDGLIILVFNIISDMVIRWLDPRARLS